MPSRLPPDIILLRDNDAPTLQGRLAAAIVRAILESRARPGTRLPSSRKLALTLGLSRMTVTLVYQELVSQGYLETAPRSGVMIAGTVPHRRLKAQGLRSSATAVDWGRWLIDAQPRKRVIRKPADWRDYRYPFIYGQADASLFDHNAWRDCARRAWGTRDFAELAADQYGADDALLVDYIRSNTLPRRGIHAGPDEVLVTLGAQNALFLAIERHQRPGLSRFRRDPAPGAKPDLLSAAARRRAGSGGTARPDPAGDCDAQPQYPDWRHHAAGPAPRIAEPRGKSGLSDHRG